MNLFVSTLTCFLILVLSEFFTLACCAQTSDSSNQINKKRLSVLIIGSSTAYVGSMISLNQLWYSNYPKQSFHFFNDAPEWKQVDKVGHFYSAFQLSNITSHALQWSNVPQKKSNKIGALTSFVIMSSIEVLDGFSSGYGASGSDMVANAAGSVFYLGQNLIWKEVRISIKNNKFIQVPSALFIESAADEYLRFNAIVDSEKESVHICRNTKTDAVTIFALQNDPLQWLRKVYVNTTFKLFHQSAALIEGVLTYPRPGSSEPLYVYVDRFKLHVLFVQGGKLIYYNQFLIKQFSDYVKYIMLVMKAMGMDQDTSRVVLWGYIGKNSPHYQEFVKYIRNVSFGARPTHLKFGYLFDELQDHHYFDLYILNLLPA